MVSISNNRVPVLRFKDDSGEEYPEWEKKKLEEILTYRQPTTYLVKSTVYSDEFETPVLTAGKTFVLGFTNETSGIFQAPLPVIIFDDFTTAFKFVKFPFKVKSSAMKILIPKDKSVNIVFVHEAMKRIRFPLGEHKRYWISEYQKEKISYACKSEQQKIASFLSSIDTRIDQLEKKKDLFEQYKKGLMQKIFNQEIRFKDDNGEEYPEWKKTKLEKVANFFSGGTPNTTVGQFYTGKIAFIRSGEIGSSSTEQYISQDGLNNSSAKMVGKGDILYALYGATSGEVAIAKINGAINQAVLCIRSQLNHYFLYSDLKFRKNAIISTFIQGGQGNLSANIIKSLKVNFPSIEEQQKIADFLFSIDRKIELIDDQVDNSREFKKGLLQQMFV